MKTTSLYGSFNIGNSISSNLKFAPVSNQDFPFILTENFQSAKLGNVHLFFSGILYNQEDLSQEFEKENLSDVDLLLHLFLKNGVKAYTKVNGKFLILIYRDEEFISVRDRYGEGPMLFFTDQYFTNLFDQIFNFKDFEATPNKDAIASYLMYRIPK